MKKEKSIQADIEGLNIVLNWWRGTKECFNKKDNEWKELCQGEESITSAISWGEAMRDAKMPEKKGCEGHGYNYSNFCGGCHKAKSRNETIDLCQPIVSKLLEDNKELRKKIKELENA